MPKVLFINYNIFNNNQVFYFIYSPSQFSATITCQTVICSQRVASASGDLAAKLILGGVRAFVACLHARSDGNSPTHWLGPCANLALSIRIALCYLKSFLGTFVSLISYYFDTFTRFIRAFACIVVAVGWFCHSLNLLCHPVSSHFE